MRDGWPAGRMGAARGAAGAVGRLVRGAGLGAWPAQRVAGALVAGGLLVLAVLLGYAGPLLAQEGVGIAFADLSREPTETTVDRFGVQLSNLDAATTYAVVVASDNATALGIGGCGTASQSQTVTGVTSQDLTFVVYACALGAGTLTAEVRAAGAAAAAATVRQGLTVLAIPEGAPPGVPGAAPASAATRGATKAGTPGLVPNVRFDNITTSSARARWDKPSNGGRTLTGFGLLLWTGPDHPDYGDAFVVGKDSRSHTYTGLQAGATYKFRIHACNNTDSCGRWTHPPKEVKIATPAPTPTPTRTATAAPPATTPGPVRNLTHTGSGKHTVTVDWDQPSSRGSAALTGYHVQHKAEGTPDWPDGSAVVTPGTTTAWTIRGLINGTRYQVQVRACNAASLCGKWVELAGSATAGNKVGNASLIPSSATIRVGQRQKFEIHDIPVGKTARTYLVGPIQPEGRCRTSGASAQGRGPSTGSGYYDSLRIDGCAPGGTGWLRVVNADESELYASAKITVQKSESPPPEREDPSSPGSGTPVSTDPECPAISGTAVVPANMQVDVVPQPRRMASLCWSPSLFGESYFVQASDNLSNLHDPDKSDWHQVQGTMEQDHVADKAQRLQLNLGQIMTKAGNVVGLAENAAYGIRIGMRDDQQRVSYTKTIIIIDTPITVANGNSAGSNSAELRWTSVEDLLNNNNYAAGSYDLRYRPAIANHAHPDWRPTRLGAFLSPKTNVTNPLTLTGLTARQVYAIQLIYREGSSTSNDSDVFAARDSYVWSSAAPATSAESSSPVWVAGIPLRYPLPSTTYEYRICEDTFPVGKQSDWSAFIQHAFEQWELATGGVVTITYSSEACTDYSNVVDAVLKEVRSRTGLPDTSFYNAVVAILSRLRWTDIRPNQIADSRLNEVIMLDDIDWDAPLSQVSDYDRRREFAFSEFAEDLGFGHRDCWGELKDNVTIACAFPTKRVGYEGYTTDIFLRRTRVEHDPLALPGGDANVDPGDISFNACPDLPPPKASNPDAPTYSVYGVLVHEVGHALGIRSQHGDYSAHPAFRDTVMTKGITKVNCSPHPLDVLAMRALYQSR